MVELSSFVSVLQWIGYILIALLCLMFMIVVHEFGHYITGKIFKFNIVEFSIGFGPKIFSKKNKKTNEVFSIRCLPLGGFCQFQGEDEEGLKEGDFNSKPCWQRILVLFNGAFLNLVSSMIIAMIFFMAVGDLVPVISNTTDYIDSDYTQQLKVGDEIRYINGVRTYGILDVSLLPLDLIKDNEENTFVIYRDGEEMTLVLQKHDFETIDLNGNPTGETSHGYGINMTFYQKQNFGNAFIKGIKFPFKVAYITFKTIGQIFTGQLKVKDTMGGTITAVSTIAQGVSYGFNSVLYVVCVLSASIGIMNLLPIPALDGSRIVFCIVEWIRKKPLDRKVEGIIHAVGLICLFGFAIILDLLHFIK